MIAQLVKYVRGQRPLIPVVQEFLDPGDRQDCVLIQTAGGQAAGYPSNRVDERFNVYVMHKDAQVARGWAEQLFGTLREIHWKDFDGNGSTGSAASGAESIFVARIFATNPPYFTGRDSLGRANYFLSVTATYQDDVNT